MPKLTNALVIIGVLLSAVMVAQGQDTHFAGQQDMNIWYNPALKTNKIAAAQVAFRNVNYPGIISYSSKAATAELPLVSVKDTDYDNIPFMNLAAGIIADNASDQFMTASTAMLGLSYALPLNDNNTYAAIGIQANYSFNRVGIGSSYHLPANFDKYGALGWALAMDPSASGYNYGYFTAGIGAAVFHGGDRAQWYIGASIRHLNRPYTEWSYSARLPSNVGIQSGYSAYISTLNQLSVYGNLSWQNGTAAQTIVQQFIGGRYIHHFNDSTSNAVSFGAGLLAGDALIPDVGLEIGQNRFAFYYEINVPGIQPGNYGRRAVGFSYRLNLVTP